MDNPSGIHRRDLLLGAGAATVGLGIGWQGLARAVPPSPTGSGNNAQESRQLAGSIVPWQGRTQAGITTPAQGFAIFVAFDVTPGTPARRMGDLMRIWTDDISRLCTGQPGLTDTEPDMARMPANLTITIGFGPSLFAKVGRETDRPLWLQELPAFSIDRLDQAWCGGDIIAQVCADDPITVEHAARYLAKEAADIATPRWVQHGFRNAPGILAHGQVMRNLFGQLDGIVQPSDDNLVFLGGDSPTWLQGGSTLVIRRIQMDLDKWDEADRGVRENSVGRDFATGAPLTGGSLHDTVDLGARGPLGFPLIDVAAHARRSQTGDPSQVVLRRPYNYSVAPSNGLVNNAGLVFTTYQADIEHQYIPIQQRLADLDLLNLWTTPIGSAVFAVPRGVRPGEYLAQDLWP